MSENLFKGKLTEEFKDLVIVRPELVKDSWVCGSLIVDKNGRTYICTHALCSNKTYVNNGITTMFEVIPETVGQFTGATDKNGKEIFKGNIVRYELSAYGKSLTKDYEIVSHNYSWGCKNEKGNISRLDLFEPSLLEVVGINMSDRKPCHKCKGHALTHGACHAKCERYNAFKQDIIEAKRDVKKSAGDARAANKYSG